MKETTQCMNQCYGYCRKKLGFKIPSNYGNTIGVTVIFCDTRYTVTGIVSS